jgi:hypothetical protein
MAIAMIPRFAKGDREEAATRWERSRRSCDSLRAIALILRSVRRRSRCNCELPRAIALISRLIEGNRNETAICQERSHGCHESPRAIVTTLWFAESNHDEYPAIRNSDRMEAAVRREQSRGYHDLQWAIVMRLRCNEKLQRVPMSRDKRLGWTVWVARSTTWNAGQPWQRWPVRKNSQPRWCSPMTVVKKKRLSFDQNSTINPLSIADGRTAVAALSKWRFAWCHA